MDPILDRLQIAGGTSGEDDVRSGSSQRFPIPGYTQLKKNSPLTRSG